MREIRIALAGNSNVGKSTLFNHLTGLRQHTGNWNGKTVAASFGRFIHKDIDFHILDIPGLYSTFAADAEESVAGEILKGERWGLIVLVVDATCLARSLSLFFDLAELTDRIVVCVNLIDEARRAGAEVNVKGLSSALGVPVVATDARRKKSIASLKDVLAEAASGTLRLCPKKILSDGADERVRMRAVITHAERLAERFVIGSGRIRHRRSADRFLASGAGGAVVTLSFFALILWLTIVGANYLSDWLSDLLISAEQGILWFLKLLRLPLRIQDTLFYGGIRTLFRVVSVMLPPMAIFFPCFTLLEDIGFLPRIAFNTDAFFKRSASSGKQSLCM